MPCFKIVLPDLDIQIKQMRSLKVSAVSKVKPTLEHYRGSGRPRSNEIIHVKLRKHASARFQLSSSLFFVLLVNRCACGHPQSSSLHREWVRVWQARR